MIPFNPKDEQQIGRKRHIGNDVVVVVFVSGKTPFSPISIQSQFNNVFVVVQPVQNEDKVVRLRKFHLSAYLMTYCCRHTRLLSL